MIKNISNLGDAALYCDFGDEVNKEINSDVIKYFNSIKENKIKGVNNLTPSYNKLIISYDLKVTNFREIKQEIEKLSLSEDTKTIGKNLEIPVCCDVSFSLDIERLEKKLSLKRDQILDDNLTKDLEKIFPLDLQNLKLNSSKYSFLMNDKAGVYDDLIITKLEEGLFNNFKCSV